MGVSILLRQWGFEFDLRFVGGGLQIDDTDVCDRRW